MKVVFKKNESVISVKVGIAWSFWFAFIFPWVGLFAFLRRRLFIQAAIVIAYVAAQTYLRQKNAIWSGVIDQYPAAGDYLTHDAYIGGQLLWWTFGFFLSGYAFNGNKWTARSLFRRGYVCPLQEHAAVAEMHWSLSSLNPRELEASVEHIHKQGPSKKIFTAEIKKELKIFSLMVLLTVVGANVYTYIITPRKISEGLEAAAANPAKNKATNKTETLPGEGAGTHVSSIVESDISQETVIDTRVGRLSLKGEAGAYDLYLGEEKIKDGSKSMLLGFKTKYDFGDRDVILAVDTQSATCSLYFFITLVSKSDVGISPSFGTCDEAPVVTKTGQRIVMKMTDSQGKKSIYFYEDGAVFENGKRIRS